MTGWPNYSVAIQGTADPTPTEGRVLDFIVAFNDQHGRFPTYREIRVEFAYRSTNSGRRHVHELDRKGWLSIKRTRFCDAGGRVTHSDRVAWALRRTTPSDTELSHIAGMDV